MLEDVVKLKLFDDFVFFVVYGVDEVVKCVVFKKFFVDLYFNVMDGFDIYIDDYLQFDFILFEMLCELCYMVGL